MRGSVVGSRTTQSHARALLSFTPITEDEIERLWESIDKPLDQIRSDEVWYEVTSLRESVRRLLTEREQR